MCLPKYLECSQLANFFFLYDFLLCISSDLYNSALVLFDCFVSNGYFLCLCRWRCQWRSAWGNTCSRFICCHWNEHIHSTCLHSCDYKSLLMMCCRDFLQGFLLLSLSQCVNLVAFQALYVAGGPPPPTSFSYAVIATFSFALSGFFLLTERNFKISFLVNPLKQLTAN